MFMTIEGAVKLNREYERAQQLAADALERRNEAVLQLLDGGVRQAEIAQRLGLTPGRVSQIADRARRQREQLEAVRERQEVAA
jgi:DNA-binding NarL/FixJ family response regulator